MIQYNPIERHPWQPFMPTEPRLLMLGTFPPKPVRWSMDFFYPNRTNDMWRIVGLIFCGDANHLWDDEKSCFRLDDIKALLDNHGIALWDTAMAVRRLHDNASDKFLEIVERIDLASLLDTYPSICTVATAGAKATAVVSEIAGVSAPAMGESVACVINSHRFTLWRMPSSSRAYPMALVKKADYYRRMFESAGILVL